MDTRKALEIVRTRIRELGMTHAELAQRLHVSAPTLRRWLKGQGLSFDDMGKMLASLDLDVAGLARRMEAHAPKRKEYTLAQERHFVAFPPALALFDALRQGATVASIRKGAAISESTLRTLLRGLESVGLVRRGAGDKVRVLWEGEPVWRKNGPLQKAFLEHGLKAFLAQCRAHPSRAHVRFGLHDMLAEDKARIMAQILALGRLVEDAEARARHAVPDQRERVGLHLAFGPFPWELLMAIEEV